VYTIATNKVRDQWRSRRHQESRHTQSVDVEEGGPQLVADAPQPAAELEATEIGDEVRAAVEELPEMLKTTFVLRFYEGLSFEAIGKMVDRNEAAVRKRYSRALSELRESLAGLEGSA
ncbi:MAG: RNA polymerase sigma factor, partial [Planctomycetota bacterium]